MKCMSCEADVDHRWKFAIARNECPNCGNAIMDEGLKALLESLGQVMAVLHEDFPVETGEWLTSNYKYAKTDSEAFEAEYVKIGSERFKELRGSHGKFVPTSEKRIIKQVNDKGEWEEVEVQSLKSEEELSEFAKRAGLKGGLSPAEHIMSLHEKVQKARSGQADMLYDTGATEHMVEADEGIEWEGVPRSAMPYNTEGEEIPAHILAMSAGSNKEAQDLARMHSLVQRSQAPRGERPSFKKR